MLDINTFNFAQMFNDSKGRTSPSKTVGFYACIVSVTVFGLASLKAISDPNEHTSNIITTITIQSVLLFGAGGTLLGIRRFTKDKEIEQKG
jgi:hypothetical protein